MPEAFQFPTRVKWGSYVRFQKWLHYQRYNGTRVLTLDFSGVEVGYPGGMVPIISSVTELRVAGVVCDVLPPKNTHTADVFRRLGWAYFLSEASTKPPTDVAKSALPLRQYSSSQELNKVVNDAVDICLQNLAYARGVHAALEWVINEIAGNVLDHSCADVGWMQIVTYPKHHSLAIVIADAGIGIPQSMRTRFPDLDDVEAVAASMEAGVTSNPSLGQGNGLAGALAIAEQNHGAFSLVSGRGRVESYDGATATTSWFPPQIGTIVELQLGTAKPIDLTKALWGHEPVSYIETRFESETGEMMLRLKEQAPTFGNRPTGLRIRNMALNLFENRRDQRVVVDVSDVKIMSSSFADELFGKLFVLLGAAAFQQWIRVDGANDVCRRIIDTAIAQRLAQSQSAS